MKELEATRPGCQHTGNAPRCVRPEHSHGQGGAGSQVGPHASGGVALCWLKTALSSALDARHEAARVRLSPALILALSLPAPTVWAHAAGDLGPAPPCQGPTGPRSESPPGGAVREAGERGASESGHAVNVQTPEFRSVHVRKCPSGAGPKLSGQTVKSSGATQLELFGPVRRTRCPHGALVAPPGYRGKWAQMCLLCARGLE